VGPEAFGAYLRAQRRLADLTLRELSELTRVSDPYLSQLERGLHRPSAQVLKAISDALEISVSSLLAPLVGGEGHDDAGGPGGAAAPDTEAAIRADPHLTEDQKRALLTVYRSYRGSP
jgi:transcriptional regulator with XRE-family HTH domain